MFQMQFSATYYLTEETALWNNVNNVAPGVCDTVNITVFFLGNMNVLISMKSAVYWSNKVLRKNKSDKFI